jgi:hypothetical protein
MKWRRSDSSSGFVFFENEPRLRPTRSWAWFRYSSCDVSRAHPPPLAAYSSIDPTPYHHPTTQRSSASTKDGGNWRCGMWRHNVKPRLNYFQKAARGHGLMRRTFPVQCLRCVNKRQEGETTRIFDGSYLQWQLAPPLLRPRHQTHWSISNGSRCRVGVVSLAATRPIQHAIHHQKGNKIWPTFRHNSFFRDQ